MLINLNFIILFWSLYSFIIWYNLIICYIFPLYYSIIRRRVVCKKFFFFLFKFIISKIIINLMFFDLLELRIYILFMFNKVSRIYKMPKWGGNKIKKNNYLTTNFRNDDDGVKVGVDDKIGGHPTIHNCNVEKKEVGVTNFTHSKNTEGRKNIVTNLKDLYGKKIYVVDKIVAINIDESTEKGEKNFNTYKKMIEESTEIIVTEDMEKMGEVLGTEFEKRGYNINEKPENKQDYLEKITKKIIETKNTINKDD